MSRSHSRHPRTLLTVLAIAALVVLAAIAGPAAILGSAHDAGLAVSITETNSPIVEGETLAVTVNVVNDGDDTHSEEVTLSIDGEVKDSKRVELQGGENRTVTLTWRTGLRSLGDYDVRVAAANDADTTTVTVEDGGPWFTVDVTETNSPVVEGERLTVNATIQNIEERSWNQTIDLRVGGEVRDTTNVSLDGGEETTVRLTWSTADGDAGNYTAVVASNQERERTSVQVRDAANISLSLAGTNSPVVEGDRLTVTAILENTGGVTATETVSLAVDGVRNNTVVNVSAGATERVTLSWATEPGDVGTYVAELSAANTTIRTAVAVLAPQHLAVQSLETNTPVEEGDPLEVTARIENVGDRTGNQTVRLSVGGVVRDRTVVHLGQAENTTVTLVWETASGDAGSYTVSVATANDTAEADVSVEQPPPDTTAANEPPTASIQSQLDGSSQETVEPGTPVEFTADASDPDGSVASYEWRVSGEGVGDGPELAYTFDEAGAYEVTLVVTDDDGATATVSRTIEVGAPEATATQTRTLATTQTTASGPGLGIVAALVAIGLVLIGFRLRSTR